jgi:hypothetical protein
VEGEFATTTAPNRGIEGSKAITVVSSPASLGGSLTPYQLPVMGTGNERVISITKYERVGLEWSLGISIRWREQSFCDLSGSHSNVEARRN